jgi:CheY-like chemotaxis protein
MDEITILAVDDTPEILESLNSILGNDYDLRLAKIATAAWTVLRLTEVNLILLDIEMPEMDGFEFLESISAKPEYNRIPVVFITSNAEREMIDKALKMGAAGYITKPFSPETLRETVASVVKQNRPSTHNLPDPAA